MKPSKPEFPLRTTLIYLLFGSLWILLSDQLLSLLVFRDTQQAVYQTLKGWFFIAISGTFLYILLRQDLSKRRQAENAVRESEERFRLLFDKNPSIMMLIEPVSGMIRDANQAAVSFYGYPLADLRTMNIGDINQLSPEQVQAERMHALREERNFFNFPHRLSNSEIRMVEVHSAPITLGEETLLFSIIHDATERRKAQQQVQDLQNRMKGIIESAMDAIISTDTSQTIVLANPAAEEMFGHDQGELIGKPLELLLPARYRQTHREHIRHFGGTGITTRSIHAMGTVYGLRSNGQEFPVEASISQISTNSDKIYTVIVRDITKRKQAEEKIQRQLQRLRALHDIDMAISSSFEMQISLEVVLKETRTQLGIDAASILLLQPETLLLEYAAGSGFISTAIQDRRVHVGESMAGRAVLERRYIYLDDLSQADSSFTRKELVQTEEFVSYFVIPLITKGEVKGVLEVYHRSTLQTDSEWLDFMETLAGQAAIAIENAQLFEHLHRSNVELEKRVIERTTELNRTNAELERANRAKDEFLATMSHELRTPLNSILGLSESLLEERRGPLNDHQQNSLRIIESSGRHLLELINDILDLSKIEAGKFDLYLEPISVDEFCNSCMAFVRSQALKKSIRLAYSKDVHFSKFLADPRRLKQILVNLLTNAVKFTPDHGQVHLRVTGDPEKELIQFSVRDTGIGIAAEDLRRLFQPFVQLDSNLNRQYQGTGLGLALVHKLTDLHGGSVHVESEAGKGSCFTINLAYRLDETLKTSANRNTAHEIDRRNTAIASSNHRGPILLAEDNMPNITTIGDYLESYGFQVLVAHNGMEAIAKAEESHPVLILMDIQMPVMNGLDAIARLRTDLRFSDIPIIALTALAMPGDRERCLAAGASEYMSKPVTLKALVRRIDEFLQDKNQ